MDVRGTPAPRASRSAQDFVRPSLGGPTRLRLSAIFSAEDGALPHACAKIETRDMGRKAITLN